MSDEARPRESKLERVPPVFELARRDVPTTGLSRARVVDREHRTGRRRRRVLALAAFLFSCGSGAPMVQSVNGCEAAAYVDRSETSADRRIGFGTALGSGAVAYEPRCMKVAVGQSVTFVGDFSTHPLSPGDVQHEAGTMPNPIQRITMGAADYAVTFSAAGLYPFYCELHEPVMAGAIWVK